MKRPNFTSYLFGNPVSIVVLGIAFLWTAYSWWTAALSGWLALLALIAVCYGYEASQRIQKFNAWKREWEAIGGNAPSGAIPIRSIRTVIGVGLCAALLIYTFATPPSPEIIAARWILGIAGIAAIAFPAFRRLRAGKASSKRITDFPVQVCVAASASSIDLASAYAALPSHCRQIIQ